VILTRDLKGGNICHIRILIRNKLIFPIMILVYYDTYLYVREGKKCKIGILVIIKQLRGRTVSKVRQ
jgi:hypothetical protein